MNFVKALAASAIAALASIIPAQAHPHVWVTARTIVQLNSGQLTGLQHAWTFDETYAADAVAGLDTNKDGKYDREELSRLAQTNMDGLKEFGYFTTASVAGNAVEFGTPTDYWLDFTDGLLTLHFTLPLVQSVPAKGAALQFTVEDPSYYIAFDFAKDVAVRFSGPALFGCKAAREKEPASTDQQNLSAAFGSQFDPAGEDGSNTINVKCPP